MTAYTHTSTGTYTKTDVKRVLENCVADIRMIAWRTGAIDEQEARDVLDDVQIMAEEGCLKTIHVQLCDEYGRIVKAHLYKTTEVSRASDRPGGNQWPRMPEGNVRILVNVANSDTWNNAKRRLKRNWGPSTHSTDYSKLSQGNMRTFSHGGYGLTRQSYG